MSFHGVVLESAIHRTLHAHGFSRSSTQASLVMTDLLSRYMTLLSSTCAKYAQHAGRTSPTAFDAVDALDELGVNLDELGQYCVSEARELGHYALFTARRVEDLNEIKSQLAEGRKKDKDDVIPLVYAPVPDVVSDESDEDEDESESDEMLVDGNSSDGMVVDSPRAYLRMSPERPIASSSYRPPLSPVSNPPSPSRKRPRLLNWQPPSHIPEFLPPFPRVVDVSSPPPIPQASQLPPLPPLPVKVEKPPLPISAAVTSPSSSDYLTREPYDQSSLASVPEWHLPTAPPIPPQTLQVKSSRLTTPQTEPALIAAYHHILTHAPSANANPQNPARHKVVMALLAHAQSNPRWDPPDTLFSSIAPCPPRVAAMTPTFPIPVTKTPPAPVDNKPVKVEEKDREPRFPPMPGKPVSYVERLSPLVSHQGSRIPDLARNVLSTSVHARVTRLAHPSVLVGNGQKLVYGQGIPAPWNSTSLPPPPPPAATPTVKPKEGPVNGIANNAKATEPPKILQDAMLFATWDYDKKDFRQPLALGRKGRVLSGQASSGSSISLGIGSRVRNGSRVGSFFGGP